jgi:hypothetical protein
MEKSASCQGSVDVCDGCGGAVGVSEEALRIGSDDVERFFACFWPSDVGIVATGEEVRAEWTLSLLPDRAGFVSSTSSRLDIGAEADLVCPATSCFFFVALSNCGPTGMRASAPTTRGLGPNTVDVGESLP